MGYTSTVTSKLKKHSIVTSGVAILSALLIGLSAMLPIELAVPLVVLFVTIGIGSLIVLGNLLYKWLDDNY